MSWLLTSSSRGWRIVWNVCFIPASERHTQDLILVHHSWLRSHARRSFCAHVALKRSWWSYSSVHARSRRTKVGGNRLIKSSDRLQVALLTVRRHCCKIGCNGMLCQPFARIARLHYINWLWWSWTLRSPNKITWFARFYKSTGHRKFPLTKLLNV